MRESKEITTPLDSHKIVIKTYLNIGELRSIEELFLSKLKINQDGVAEQVFDGTILGLAQNRLIENAVISIDGKIDKIIDEVQTFRKEDFDFLIEQLDKMKAGEFDIKKKLQ